MKSKPIGVRFDLEKLEKIQKEQELDSPQKVLNWLMDNYESAVTWNTRMAQTAEAIKEQPKTTITTSSTKIIKSGNPEPKEGSMAWYLKNAPKGETPPKNKQG